MLNEEEIDNLNGEGWTTFIFMENLIPVSENEAKPIEEIEYSNDRNVLVGQSQNGIEINIKNDSNSFDVYTIPDTYEYLVDKNLAVTRFLSAIKDYMK